MPQPLQPVQLPDSFPLFPLGGALLLPQGRLPLNIFEPRYLRMVEDALEHGRYLGMVQPNRHQSPGPWGPGLYRVGCLGRVTAFEETDDGRYLITLTGVIRFTTMDEPTEQRGYLRVRGAFSTFFDDLAASVETVLPFPRSSLFESLRRYFAAVGVEINWDNIDKMEDTALLTSLCMACPFTVEEKQALLEAQTIAQRAQTLRTLLEIHAFDGASAPPPSSKIN